MAARVILHVGVPKTGTSAIQDTLFGQRESLQESGTLYPADRFDQHFLAALDLMQLHWGGLERQSVGAWDRLAEQARAWQGDVVISHEILGRASRLQAERAIASLSGSPQAEVHLVVSARDFVRQLPAEWQENVKHRRTLHYRAFLDKVQDPDRSSELAQWFWGVQEVPAILQRWGSGLPPEHVHVVTVPPPGADRDLLWHRFARAFGLDPERAVPSAEHANVSLGVAESALVRRLNEGLDVVLPNQHYREFVREKLVHRNLATVRESARLTLPPEVREWAAGISKDWAAELDRRGYDVVGDLDDLVPGQATLPFVDPDHPDEAEVAAAALRALTGSVLESARLRDVEIELRGAVDDLARQLDAAHSTPVHRLKQRLVASAETNPLARLGLVAYRLVRGRNSRSA